MIKAVRRREYKGGGIDDTYISLEQENFL